MTKKIFSFLVLSFLLILSFLFIINETKASTFTPCGPHDVICNLDCEWVDGVCGLWGSDTPVDNCPAGQKLHPTAGTCIYENDAVCRSVYGEAFYDGNANDGCGCLSGSTYIAATGLCEFPVNCPAGQSQHPVSKNCIYNSDASCRSAYGEAYYDGNDDDGCGCLSGAIYSHESGLCEFPIVCPEGEKVHPVSKNCIYANDAVCRSVYGEAYYDGNDDDGCGCLVGAIYSHESGLCEFPILCPEGEKVHPVSQVCIYANDAVCRSVYGESYYDGNEIDGCGCIEGADYNNITELCEFYPECPDGQKMHAISENCIYEDDAMCRAHYGESYYDGNEIDGCACLDHATWNGVVCESNLEIKVDSLQFTLAADGESQKEISAWLEDSNGQKVNIPVWIKLQTPNFINPGNLEIYSGAEGSGENSVSAIYTAPFIENIEKIENADLIQDLIYIFAEVNGELTYKVITATVETLAGDFNVTLKFEKDGLIERTINTTFNEGSLSGSVYFMDESERFDPNGVKVILDGVFPDSEKAEIHMETFSSNGTFFFENLGETGEFILDAMEIQMDEIDYGYYDKFERNKNKAAARVNKFGGNISFLNPYTELAENYAENLSEAKYEDAEDVIDSLKMAAYTAYFVEYYGRKADESLDNFTSYMGNVLVDTIGFVQGMVNFTGGIFESAAGKNAGMSKVVNNWLAKKDNISQLRIMGQKALRTVLNTLRIGLSYTSKSDIRIMNSLQDLIGGIESLYFGETLNVASYLGPSQIKSAFTNYMKRGYLEEMAKSTGKYSIDLNNIPDNVDANIKKAENLFKENTEAHDYRNALQYEWDVDTSAVTEFINALKPGIKVGLSLYLGNPVLANKIVDKANHAFNALKIAASANHSYEWFYLYKADFQFLEKSLAIMNTGQSLAWENNLELIPIIENIEINNFELIKTANATAPEIKESDILFNIVIAIEANDKKALADNLERLDNVREVNSLERENNMQYINDYAAYLNESENNKAVETLMGNSDLDFASEIMNIRLINLVADPSSENITLFIDEINKLAEIEDQLLKDNLEVYDMVANLDKEDLVQVGSESDDILMSDIYMILSFLSLLIGGIVSGIMFKKKGKKAGFISLGITFSIVLLFIVLTGITYNNEIV